MSPQRIVTAIVAASVVTSTLLSAQSPQSATAQGPALMDREKEIASALSSCPPPLAPKAGVYTLEASGYVKIRDGQNGFTAIVQHAMPTSQDPQCMDTEGRRTFLPRMLKVAELRAQGKTAADIQSLVMDAIAKGVLPAPQHPGVIYMLSTQNLVPNTKGGIVAFPPHVMFYGTNLTNSDLGVDRADLGPDGNPKGPTFVAGAGPYALLIVPTTPHVTGHGK